VYVGGGGRQVLRALEPQQRAIVQKACVKWAVYSASDFCSAAALRMILSSTSVMFMTWSSRKPLAASQRRRTSTNVKVRKFPMCA